VLSYNIQGSGQPLLLLHGALISRAMWTQQVEAFSKTYQVITCDLPGHGKSPDVVGEYTIERLGNSLTVFLDALNIQQLAICGHSLGGMVAQQLAATQPERVKKLILVETAFGTHNSWSEYVQTVTARLFLRWIPQSTLVHLSTRRYGSLNQHVASFIRQEMSRYSAKKSFQICGLL
jgi:pimeloyl-ACP methyl ester carboxylesterase